MGDNVLPAVTPSSSTMLRVQATSRLAFGATTAALVTLASGGTAVLVSHGTGVISSPTSIPGGVVAVEPAAADGGVVVERAPGTLGTPPSAGATLDPTVQALENALAHRPQPGRRTLLVPLVDVTPPVMVPAASPAPVAAPEAEAEPELPGQPGRLHNPTSHVPAATAEVSAVVRGVVKHAGGKHARPGKARGRHAH